MVCSGGLRQGLLIYVTKVQESRSGLFQHAVFEFSRSPVFFFRACFRGGLARNRCIFEAQQRRVVGA